LEIWDSQTFFICGIDSAGRLVRATPRFLAFISGGGKSVPPSSLASLIHPEDRPLFHSELERIFDQSGVMERRPVRMITPDGRVTAMLVTGELASGPNGDMNALLFWQENPEGGRIDAGSPNAPFMDASTELERYEEVVKSFISSLFQPVFIISPEGRIVHANDAALTLLECRRFDLAGRPVAAVFEKDPEKIPQAMLRFIKMMRGGKIQDQAGTFYTRHGNPIPVTVSCSVLRSGSGELIGMALVARDERKNALMMELEQKNEQLMRTFEELKALDRMKDDILSLVGHELRAPLSNILGYSEFLKEWDLTEVERKEYTRIIYTESQRLSRLVNDILDLSRMEAGRMTYIYVRDSLNRVVEAAVDSLRPDAEEKNLRLELHLESQLEPFEFDPDRIQQVVTNVVHNAIKFSHSGESIRIYTEQIEGGARVTVADRGLGIDPKDAAKVFNKFEQVLEVAHHSKGAGLGLSIAKQIIEEGHAGKIWFESDGKGRGTVFKFTIPERKLEP
jgi:PAS domain S-box-containing protein